MNYTLVFVRMQKRNLWITMLFFGILEKNYILCQNNIYLGIIGSQEALEGRITKKTFLLYRSNNIGYGMIYLQIWLPRKYSIRLTEFGSIQNIKLSSNAIIITIKMLNPLLFFLLACFIRECIKLRKKWQQCYFFLIAKQNSSESGDRLERLLYTSCKTYDALSHQKEDHALPYYTVYKIICNRFW